MFCFFYFQQPRSQSQPGTGFYPPMIYFSSGWRPGRDPLPAAWWGLHPGLSWRGILCFVQAICLRPGILEDPLGWGVWLGFGWGAGNGGVWGRVGWWDGAGRPGDATARDRGRGNSLLHEKTCICDASRPRDQSLAFPPAVFRALLLYSCILGKPGWAQPRSVERGNSFCRPTNQEIRGHRWHSGRFTAIWDTHTYSWSHTYTHTEPARVIKPASGANFAIKCQPWRGAGRCKPARFVPH